MSQNNKNEKQTTKYSKIQHTWDGEREQNLKNKSSKFNMERECERERDEET